MRSRSERAGAPAGLAPDALAAEPARPLRARELWDGAFTLVRERPALLLGLGSLHSLPLALALAGLALLPGRAFPLVHPSAGLVLLSVVTAAAVALRPFAAAAVAHAVSSLMHGGEPSAGECLRATASRAPALVDVSARALLADAVRLFVPRLAGARHLLAALVALEGMEPGAARREAARLHDSFPGEHVLLNAHGLGIWLVTVANLGAGLLLLPRLARVLLGVDVAMLEGFLTPRNLPLVGLVLVAAFLAVEPFRACAKALLLLDLRLRERGSDLVRRLERLP